MGYNGVREGEECCEERRYGSKDDCERERNTEERGASESEREACGRGIRKVDVSEGDKNKREWEDVSDVSEGRRRIHNGNFNHKANSTIHISHDHNNKHHAIQTHSASTKLPSKTREVLLEALPTVNLPSYNHNHHHNFVSHHHNPDNHHYNHHHNADNYHKNPDSVNHNADYHHHNTDNHHLHHNPDNHNYHYHHLNYHNLLPPQSNSYQNHHYGSKTVDQVLRLRQCLPWVLGVLLLLLLLTIVSILRTSSLFPGSQGDDQSKEIRRPGDEMELREGGGEGGHGRVWPQTAALLPTLFHHYHTQALSIHQPHQYKSQENKQAWHFNSIKQRSQHAQVDLFLHTAIKSFDLIVTLNNNTNTYDFILDRHAHQISVSDAVGGDINFTLPYETMKTLRGDWVIVDITEFMKNWLFEQSQFTLELSGHHNLSSNQFLMLQPVVCVKEYGNIETRSSGDSPHWVVRNFVSTSQEEEEKPRDHLRTSRNLLDEHSRERRRSISRECRLRHVEVSLQKLGLREVEYPEKLLLKYCMGSCHILDHPDPFSVNALIRAKYRLVWGHEQVPAPQCIPVSYQSQLLFVWHDGHLKLATYNDLNALTCGCR